jgi:hypothetical protein
MHGPRLRARKRPKKSAVTWLTTPQQQCEAALKLIQPAPEQRAECEAKIMVAIKDIHNGKIDEPGYRETRKQIKRRLLAKKFRAVEIAGTNFRNELGKLFLEQLKAKREFLEQPLSARAKQRVNLVKLRTASHAYRLVKAYSRSKPALTEGGPWHQLAAILFGYTGVDLFNFDYLKLYHFKNIGPAAKLTPFEFSAAKVLGLPPIWE